MAKPIDLIIFDFDGTLVDSNAIKRKAFYELLPGDAKFNAILDEVLETDYTATRQYILANVMNRYHSDKETARRHAQDCVVKYGEITTRMVVECPQIDGAEDLLDALKNDGYTLALNSGTPKDILVEIAHLRGWEHWFEFILGAPQLKSDNISSLAQRMNLAPSSIIMVGDRETDREGAKGAKCNFIGLIRPDSDFITKPDFFVTSLKTLKDFIETTWPIRDQNTLAQQE
ncbi:MAG: HAD family hydrolase [Rhodospirillales bacterium]|nr:HAD family hydrolase [Rhodospirillales bacterium]